jgi:hypothetical protein
MKKNASQKSRGTVSLKGHIHNKNKKKRSLLQQLTIVRVHCTVHSAKYLKSRTTKNQWFELFKVLTYV